MKVIIQSPGFKADQKLLDFITQKLQKLDQLNDSILEGNVCLKLDKSDTRENKVCEIKLPVRGNDLFASKQSQSFEDATNKVITALKRQLKDLKKEYKGGDVPELKG
jgi:putative sigma-54 modulation protein